MEIHEKEEKKWVTTEDPAATWSVACASSEFNTKFFNKGMEYSSIFKIKIGGTLFLGNWGTDLVLKV